MSEVDNGVTISGTSTKVERAISAKTFNNKELMAKYLGGFKDTIHVATVSGTVTGFRTKSTTDNNGNVSENFMLTGHFLAVTNASGEVNEASGFYPPNVFMDNIIGKVKQLQAGQTLNIVVEIHAEFNDKAPYKYSWTVISKKQHFDGNTFKLIQQLKDCGIALTGKLAMLDEQYIEQKKLGAPIVEGDKLEDVSGGPGVEAKHEHHTKKQK